jgi:WhiB family redox-sensing transcriptional regulator
MVDDDSDAEYATETYAAECPNLSFLAHRPGWQRRASCRGADTDLWFPVSGISKAARAVCEACPVRRLCLEYAIASSRVLQGIWAGTTEPERAQMRRERRARKAVTPALGARGLPLRQSPRNAQE